MLKKTIAAGVIALGALVAAAPAQAGGGVSVRIDIGQPGYTKHYGDRYDYDRTFSPREIRRILRRQGFSEIRYVDRRGSIYRARAEDWRGRDVAITVSARTGAILEVQRLRHRG